MTSSILTFYGLSIFGGLAFAFLAFKLSSHTAALQGNANFELQLFGITVSAGNALVALFIISACVTLAGPLYLLYLSNGDASAVMLTLAPKEAMAQAPRITDDLIAQYPDNETRLLIYRTGAPQVFSVSYGCSFGPISVKAWFERPSAVRAEINGNSYSVDASDAEVKVPIASVTCPPNTADLTATPSPAHALNQYVNYPDPSAQTALTQSTGTTNQ